MANENGGSYEEVVNNFLSNKVVYIKFSPLEDEDGASQVCCFDKQTSTRMLFNNKDMSRQKILQIAR